MRDLYWVVLTIRTGMILGSVFAFFGLWAIAYNIALSYPLTWIILAILLTCYATPVVYMEWWLNKQLEGTSIPYWRWTGDM